MKLDFKFKSGKDKEQGKNDPSGKSFDIRQLPIPTFLKNPMLHIILGMSMILMMTVLLFTGASGERNLGKAQEQAQRVISQLSEPIQSFTRLLDDEQVRALAVMAIEDPDTTRELEQYLSGRLREFRSVHLFGPDDYLANPAKLGEQGWIVMDMLIAARSSGKAPVQLLGEDSLASAISLGEGDEITGFMLVTADRELFLSAFDMTLPSGGYIAVEQNNGRYTPTLLESYGDVSAAANGLSRRTIPGSLFRVVIPNAAPPSSMSGLQKLVFLLGGCLLLAFGIIIRQRNLHPLRELEEDPAQLRNEDEEQTESQDRRTEPEESPQPEPDRPQVDLGDLPFTLAGRKHNLPSGAAPVELTPEIFRAYDIRGIVGQSLDDGIARQVGQAIGTQALEDNAGPVVVARDGRHSGPALVKGMIEGISSTGCDVIDIGMVPTGVLYFAAYEAGSGSGVMVTGSHNPPDYNGFKVMLGGQTLAQERITALYDRLAEGDIRIGKGKVTQQERLEAYRDRIAGDIQLKKPIKVVADCGNGVGGVCAADVLRAIGAEVLPLFDEVDGDFPNHHPDPSDPHNLEDLIESVSMMQADLGVAFDGDADRLGVVTSEGEIIYSDRLMMLFAQEVLSRNPGAKIIYDVKCTGKLDGVIRDAGGEPEMFKTGHSLIKNRMKEVEAPFAGEMSGHFFFKDRWYGFDCGIYSAARLLEILAMDERTPLQVLGSLPSSISTPELKVQMSEGENHQFVADFQEKARFADARVNTIDGLRADFEYGWGLVRASNTTPILVVRFEADSEESLEIIKESFRLQMLSVRKDLKLPF